MKIAVNLLFIEFSTNNGISKHIEDILTGLEKMGVLDEFYLLVQQRFYDHYLRPVDAPWRFKNAHVVICAESRLFTTANKLQRFKYLFRGIYLHRFVLPRALKKIDPDLVFCPFNDTTNNTSLKYPFVVVIHDLFYKKFLNWRKKLSIRLYAVYVDFKHRLMLKNSVKVITISEFVKSEILKYFPGTKSDKIAVIPNAVIISGQTAAPEVIKTPFLLCVNEHGIHKNHITLIKAYNIIKNRIPHRLILLGAEREATPDLLKYIGENSLGGKIDLLKDISDSERNWLYKNTDLLISPSLNEGFGRTPVEAAMMGAMVLTSRETSLPEITRELIDYYEPATDENALAAKILELLARPTSEERRKNIAATYQELYNPVRIAGMHYNLFRDIIQKKK